MKACSWGVFVNCFCFSACLDYLVQNEVESSVMITSKDLIALVLTVRSSDLRSRRRGSRYVLKDDKSFW